MQGKSNYCVCDHVNELFMYDQIRHPIETVCYWLCGLQKDEIIGPIQIL